MKKLFLLILISVSEINAQTVQIKDSISGIYVDGKKIKEISCLNFKEMYALIPVKEVKKSIVVECLFNVDGINSFRQLSDYDIESSEVIDNHLKVYIFKDSAYCSVFQLEYQPLEGACRLVDGGFVITKGYLKYTKALILRPEKRDCSFTVKVGEKITGYNEYYSSSCNCYKKRPTYDFRIRWSFSFVVNDIIKLKPFQGTPETRISLRDQEKGCKTN